MSLSSELGNIRSDVTLSDAGSARTFLNNHCVHRDWPSIEICKRMPYASSDEHAGAVNTYVMLRPEDVDMTGNIDLKDFYIAIKRHGLRLVPAVSALHFIAKTDLNLSRVNVGMVPVKLEGQPPHIFVVSHEETVRKIEARNLTQKPLRSNELWLFIKR